MAESVIQNLNIFVNGSEDMIDLETLYNVWGGLLAECYTFFANCKFLVILVDTNSSDLVSLYKECYTKLIENFW